MCLDFLESPSKERLAKHHRAAAARKLSMASSLGSLINTHFLPESATPKALEKKKTRKEEVAEGVSKWKPLIGHDSPPLSVSYVVFPHRLHNQHGSVSPLI